MHQSDVYVLPSDGGEGWGAVLNEAMEEGCAVIATRECGSGETMIKDGENGLLFNAGDVNGLVRCLTRLQDDPELRSKVSASGRKTVVQLWNPEIAAERLLSVCDALLYGRKVPSFTDGPMMSIPYKIGSKHQA
jgi:glycosyltransferase involved in cell wall biosynthesis